MEAVILSNVPFTRVRSEQVPILGRMLTHVEILGHTKVKSQINDPKVYSQVISRGPLIL